MKQTDKIGKFFTLEDFTRSEKARIKNIDNTPTVEHMLNLKKLVVEILDPLYFIIGDFSISSGYRSKLLNEAVGGVSTSGHSLGQAADIVCEDAMFLFEMIRDNFVYDQVILETLDIPKGKTSWVHVAYREGQNRGESFLQHNHKRTSAITINKKWN